MTPWEIFWTILGILESVLVGTVFSVLGMAPPEFRLARLCFWLSAALLGVTDICWTVTTRNSHSLIWLAGVDVPIWITIAVGLPSGLRWVRHKETGKPKQTDKPKDDIPNRLSSLISEAVGLQNICEQVRDPYSTPAHNRPDLANAIVNWKQRAEGVLSFDTDPRPLQMWKEAVLRIMGDPKGQAVSSIAIYCTELNLKMNVLNRILTRKSVTVAERIGQISRFISEGNSIKQACQADAGQLADESEGQWMLKVMQWLSDIFDEHYAQDFNHALHPADGPMPGDHSEEIKRIWNRTHARTEVLGRIKKELSN